MQVRILSWSLMHSLPWKKCRQHCHWLLANLRSTQSTPHTRQFHRDSQEWRHFQQVVHLRFGSKWSEKQVIGEDTGRPVPVQSSDILGVTAVQVLRHAHLRTGWFQEAHWSALWNRPAWPYWLQHYSQLSDTSTLHPKLVQKPILQSVPLARRRV